MAQKEAVQTLKRSLGLFHATAISLGAIIGSGIFVVTGIAAGLAGSALVVSMVLAAAIATFTALSFAELTTWQPVEGSVYEYARQLISPFFGFLAGWMWFLSNTFTGSASALGFAYYLTAVLPVLPSNVVAAVLCIVFTALNFIGVRQSALLNSILVVAKVLILLFFVIFGACYVEPANFTPFEPFNAGVLYGACFSFFAYIGFARVAVVAEEIKDAEHNIPRAMILSLCLSAIIYVLVGAVAVGLVGSAKLASSNAPLTEAISVTGSAVGTQIVSFGGLLATASVLLTSILGVSRMAYSMAKRRDMPQSLARLHLKFCTPYYAIAITGALMAVFVLLVDITKVVVLSTFATLFYYALTNIAAFKLKIKQRHYSRLIPAVGLSTCLAFFLFIFFVATQAWIISIVCLILGTIYYRFKTGFKKQDPIFEY